MMMSSCAHLDGRDQARAAIARVCSHPTVEGHDLLTPDADPTDRWTLELTIDHDGLPPAVAEILADEGLTIRHTGPRADWWHVVAVV